MPHTNASPLPRTLALVDDDRNIVASVAMALEAEGYGVRSYADGGVRITVGDRRSSRAVLAALRRAA